MSEPVRIRICEVSQAVRNVHLRMPFRYGGATMTAVPVLHLRTLVEDAQGRRAEGWSADGLPPGWFDKRPGRGFADDIASLRFAVDQAVAVYLAGGLTTAFDLWHQAYHGVREQGFARGENGLTCGFGPALVERSVIDAVGKLGGTEVHETFRQNRLGVDLAELHPELAGWHVEQSVGAHPLDSLAVRQTVGLGDPLTEADLGDGDRLHDHLPQTLEEYLVETGLRYLKIKLCGRLDDDLARLRAIAALLERLVPQRYVLTLDGNEQFAEPAGVAALLEALAADHELRRCYDSIAYIEQPFARQVALDPEVMRGLPELNALKPITIDESDDRLEAFKLALELGYSGIAVKNCKGVTKAVANYALARRFTILRSPLKPYFLTGEDLMNTPAIPLQQDLATAAMLGIADVERNGHHYVRGLDHLSPAEIEGCLEQHPSLYEPLAGGSGRLFVCDGLVDLRSLHHPGYAVAVPPDWAALTPAEQWRYEDLGMPA